MRRRVVLAAGCAGLGYLVNGYSAQASLRPVTVWVQGKHHIKQLPLLLAQRLGFFAAEGIDVQFHEVPPAVRTLTEVAALPATVFSGSFERTLYLNAMGKSHQSFVALSRSPQVVLGMSVRHSSPNAAWSDLVGGVMGVPTIGGTAHRVAQLALLRAGLRPSDVQFMEMPDPAMAMHAFSRGDVDALSYTDPLVTQLERMGEFRVLSDTRTLRDTESIFGGPVTCTCMSAPEEFIERNPQLIQSVTDAIVRALKWLHTAGPQDLVRHTPEEWKMFDLGVYLAAFNRSRETISVDGMSPPRASSNVLRALDKLRLPIDVQRINPDTSYTNRFVIKSKQRFRV